MLKQYKNQERSQKLLEKFGKAAEDVMDSNPPMSGEPYDDWMKRAGAIFKASQPKKEVKVYTPEPTRVRGYYTDDRGQKCREYIGYGGRVVHEVVRDHWYDQDHDMGR